MLIPAGSRVRGVVTAVKRPGRVDRVGSLELAFDQIAVRGRTYPIRAMATQVFESGGIRDEAGTAGVGAGAGAIIGGLLGGLKGAVLGAVIGAGGVVAATEGKDVILPTGSVLRIRLDSVAQGLIADPVSPEVGDATSDANPSGAGVAASTASPSAGGTPAGGGASGSGILRRTSRPRNSLSISAG